MLRAEFPAPRSRFDLFDFVSGTADDYRRLVDFGHLPWWTHPELRLRMWRPLSSALIALDHTLFDTDARWHHAHSLIWFVVLLWAAGRLLWRCLPERSAALALWLFAAGPCHTLPVGWLANRCTLVATALGFLAVDLQLQNQRSRSVARSLACAALSVLALLAGEYALTALAYALPLCLLGASGRLGERLRAAWPLLLPMAVYLPLHTLVGSDIVHSGFYLSPVGDPAGFAAALFTRVPALVADLLFGLPSYFLHAGTPLRNTLLSWQLFSPEVWQRLPAWHDWHVGIGYLACAAGVGALLWLRPRADWRALRWLSLGAALSLLPCAGSLPEDRLLTAATLGSSALLASLLLQAFPWQRGLQPTAARWQLVALWLAALWLPASALYRSYDDVRAVVRGSAVARAWCLDADMPDAAASGHTRVYVLAAADFNTAVNLPWLRLLERHAPVPLSYRRLSPGPLPVDLRRIGERVLQVDVLTNNVAGTAVPSLYRAADTPMRRQQIVSLPGLRVDILEVLDGNPTRLRFSFDRSLDDPDLWFLIAGEQGLRHSALPALGETVRVPYAQYRDIR
jgi:hypothetical protein